MHVASVVGWKNGERPSVPNNLKIDAIATGLQHPRSLYTLPNGDILVIESKAPGTEPIKRPKDFIMKWVESWATWREYLTADDLEREKVLETAEILFLPSVLQSALFNFRRGSLTARLC
jgi:glucose/arabinose dehydrogenase